MSRLEVHARSRLSPRFLLDVSFSLDFDAERPIAALFGPSGSGKSTTLALIAGLRAPDRGLISFDGIRLADMADRTLLAPEDRAIGLVAQDGLLFPHLTVGENLDYALRRSRGRPRASRAEIVDALALSPLLPRGTHGLSGGERQRVALGRALLTGPRLLLLDEPVSALDEAARWEALTLIERVTRRFAVPALYVSHQRAEIARVARHTARLSDGRIVASGETSTVLADASEGGSVPNLFRAVYVDSGRATVEGGATIELPHPGPIGGEVWCRLESGAIALMPVDEARGMTARNRLSARVVAVDTKGHRVRVAVDAGVALHADVTPETAAELRLRPGTPVACVFKVHSLEVLG